jgi:hypothetical protein
MLAYIHVKVALMGLRVAQTKSRLQRTVMAANRYHAWQGFLTECSHGQSSLVRPALSSSSSGRGSSSIFGLCGGALYRTQPAGRIAERRLFDLDRADGAPSRRLPRRAAVSPRPADRRQRQPHRSKHLQQLRLDERNSAGQGLNNAGWRESVSKYLARR